MLHHGGYKCLDHVNHKFNKEEITTNEEQQKETTFETIEQTISFEGQVYVFPAVTPEKV